MKVLGHPLKTTRILFLSLLLAFLSTSLFATTVIHLNDDELTQRSDFVIQGTVVSVDSAVREGPMKVFTMVQIQVEDVWKGNWLEPTAYVSIPGGTLDGTKVHVPGTPKFIAGEEVVVFLEQLKTGEQSLAGLAQGRFEVVRQNGNEELIRNLGSGHYVRPSNLGAGQGLVKDERTQRESLSSFKEKVFHWSQLETIGPR